MGFNAAQNAVALLIFLYLFLGFAFIFTVGNQLDSGIKGQITTLGISIDPIFTNYYAESKAWFFESVKWLMWLFIGLTIISSWVNSTDLKDYFFGSLASIIASALVTFIGAVIWNGFLAASNGALDFSDMGGGVMFVIENFASIVVINMVAGLLSFVWIRRGQDFTQAYYNPYGGGQ